ncbi:2,4-dienoyl-CoA reductase [Salmonella enterica subsp. enterica]|uniref:2,4-dienoyl-CoA reductase n=1 Tax=Salmonella enterica I TaxID=59201 RepID=A0A447N3J3_SALET|nr:2,4-dienoyl-CoA reductase [Salmonella enterica subsp. enterica]
MANPPAKNIAEFCTEWGIDTSLQQAGGLRPEGPRLARSPRQIVMLQRKASKPGEGLGKTTGWIHRATLLARGVKMIPAVSYQKIDDDGLHLLIGGEPQLLEVDHVVICAGQEPRRELADPLRAAGKTVHLIGGMRCRDGAGCPTGDCPGHPTGRWRFNDFT